MWTKVAVTMGLVMLALSSSLPAQQANSTPPNTDSEKVASQVKGSVALVLVGSGAGRLESTGSAVVAKSGEMLGAVKTLTVNSRTSFFTPDALENELAKKPELSAWGIRIVRDVRVADIVVSIDRPLFTYDFTYTATDTRTSIVLASGKVTAVDGVRAAPIIAKNLVLQMAKAHQALEPKPVKQ